MLSRNKRRMDSIGDRNLASHDYDGENTEEICRDIIEIYYPLFVRFEQKMTELAGTEPQFVWRFLLPAGSVFLWAGAG